MEHCPYCSSMIVKGTTCPRTLVCGRCHAPAGRGCVRPSGHRAAELHTERVDAAEALDRERGILGHY